MMLGWLRQLPHLLRCHLACCGTTDGWRQRLVVLAIMATALELAFFAPFRITMWFSSPSFTFYSLNNRTANFTGMKSVVGSMLPPPPVPPPPPAALELSSSAYNSSSTTSSAQIAQVAVFASPTSHPQSATLPPPASELSSRTYNSTSTESSALTEPVDFFEPPYSSHSQSSRIPPPVSELSLRTYNSRSKEMSAPTAPVALSPPLSSHSVENPSRMRVINSTRSDQKDMPLLLKKSIWKMTSNQQLLYAKKEIENAPVVLNDPDLHAPLFRNVSVFKRSYELMERILKVYIYEEGPVPLFHTPLLSGIYASEGWFMKLMEENKQFVVKDPNKAHLFYLAYSSRQLRTHLYNNKLRKRNPLRVFLRDYVNMIAAKYPFWNRSRGADHFLVACHDWASYSTKLHLELRRNTIKAICNADVSDGVYVCGKDVSLPETKIIGREGPQWGIGGEPAFKRSILAFYAGKMHGHVRPILLQHWKGKDTDMRIYEALPDDIARIMSYVQHMKSSKFCICPRGYEVNSPRIVESIYYECVPVIIADNFVLPFDEVLNWSAFSIVIAEKDIPKLKDILLQVTPRQYTTMQMNVKRLQKHFLWNTKSKRYDLFHMILHSVWFNRLNQIKFQD